MCNDKLSLLSSPLYHLKYLGEGGGGGGKEKNDIKKKTKKNFLRYCQDHKLALNIARGSDVSLGS